MADESQFLSSSEVPAVTFTYPAAYSAPPPPAPLLLLDPLAPDPPDPQVSAYTWPVTGDSQPDPLPE